MPKLKDLIEQNPDLQVTIFDILKSADPSTTNKYLPFLIRLLRDNIKESEEKTLNDHILTALFGYSESTEILKKFHDHCSAKRIKGIDIGTVSFDDLRDEVEAADEKIRIKSLTKQVIKLLDDEKLLILIPLSFEACEHYGAKTKWCITERSSWNQYFGYHKIIIIIDKSTKKKFAIDVHYNEPNEITIFDEEDDPINPLFLPLTAESFPIIRKEICTNSYETELSYLGNEVIIDVDEGILNVKNATDEQIESFIDMFDNSESELVLNFIEILRKKITHDEDGYPPSESDYKTSPPIEDSIIDGKMFKPVGEKWREYMEGILIRDDHQQEHSKMFYGEYPKNYPFNKY